MLEVFNQDGENLKVIDEKEYSKLKRELLINMIGVDNGN